MSEAFMYGYVAGENHAHGVDLFGKSDTTEVQVPKGFENCSQDWLDGYRMGVSDYQEMNSFYDAEAWKDK
jgi:hypothetical protein